MSDFQKWFIESFPYLKEYFENTSFDGTRFLPKDDWHPEHCNSASTLNIALKAWGDQQVKVENQQKQIDAGLEKIRQFGKEGCLFPEWLTWAEKALRGDHE